MSVYLIYMLTVAIGIYTVYINLPILFTIGIPQDETQFGRFASSFFPVLVGIFMIYFGLTSLYTLLKKRREEQN